MTATNFQLISPPETRVVWSGAVGANYSIAANDPKGSARACRRIVIGTAGTLVLTGLDGVDITLPSLPAGYTLDGQFTAIKAAGSTAFNLIIQW